MSRKAVSTPSRRMQSLRSAMRLGFIALLSGGTLTMSCPTRLKEAVVAGTEAYVLSLFDPALAIPALTGSDYTGP